LPIGHGDNGVGEMGVTGLTQGLLWGIVLSGV
jgi:hypothetical protein